MSKLLEGKGKSHRQNRVMRLLSLRNDENALSIAELTRLLNAEGFNVSGKTISRDIDEIGALENNGLAEVGSNPTLYFINGEFEQKYELAFDENQLQTMVLALQSLKQMSPEVLKSLCTEVEQTLIAKLPKDLAREFNYLKTISSAAPTILGEGGVIDPGVLQTVLHCLRKGKVFECIYHSPDDAKISHRMRLFAPLKVHLVGSPYLYVYDWEDNNIKLLRVSRIHNVIMTDYPVKKSRAKEINLDYVFGGYGKGSEKIIHYAITCTRPMAQRFNEHKLHPTQKIEALNGGLFKITFSVHDSLEVTRLLAQYGEFIQNIAPESQYDKVKEIWKKGLDAS